MYKQTTQKKLSFEGERLIRGRHKIHPYPAMLHPLLVDSLIDKYANKNDIIFDPFCGSGVTLLQSSMKGYSSVGFDINPLALLISKTKTKKYNGKKLKNEFICLEKELIKNKKTDIPHIKNIDYWYTKEVIKDLGKIRYVLLNNNYEYRDFFTTAFAFICRNQSLTRNCEFKRYRIKAEKIESNKNQVFEKFLEHIRETIEIFVANDFPIKNSRPLLANSENVINKKLKYNLVITSPPYGDSRTTVAYGEYSSFGLEWIKSLNPFGDIQYKIDKEGLGRINLLNNRIRKHKILIDILEKIESIDQKRANEVLYFFNGYFNVIENVVNNLKNKGTVCFVVGNRTVKGYQIPMDQITASFLESFGLKFEGIFVRDISNKIMPSQNSPSNQAGQKGNTMKNEYIVIFKKK